MGRIRSAAGHAYKRVNDVVDAGADEVVGAMQVGVDNVLDRTLDYAGNVVRGHLKDPDMPGFAERGVDHLVDSFWPDVKEETKSKVLKGLHKSVPVFHGTKPAWCPNPYYRIRAWFLYHIKPFDKAFWGKARDPVYWLFLLIALVPVYGISQMFYFLVFLTMDWGDEFQVVQFILGFKGMQFLTTGLFPAIIAAVRFYVCVVHSGRCDRDGPGEDAWVYIVFLVQVLVVWVAFALLPTTLKKGARTLIVRGRTMRKYDFDGDGLLNPDEARAYARRRDSKKKAERARKAKNSDESEESSDLEGDLMGTAGQRCCCCMCYPRRGGALRWFIIYEVITLIVAVAIVALPMYVGPTPIQDNDADGDGANDGVLEDTWAFRASLELARIAYGLLAFPFVVFNLPCLGVMLTHAQETGYNSNGVTVPFIRPTKIDDEEYSDADGDAAHAEMSRLRKLSKRFRGSSSSAEPEPSDSSTEPYSFSGNPRKAARARAKLSAVRSRWRGRGRGGDASSESDDDDDYTYETVDEGSSIADSSIADSSIESA